MSKRAGFTAIVGRPNAGKSTLLNHLLEYKLSLVSKKANATRKRLNAIVMHNSCQIILVDTPGIHKKEKLLNTYMLEETLKAIGDCDFIVYVAAATDSTEYYEQFLESSGKDKKHLLLLSKADMLSNEKLLAKISQYSAYAASYEALIPLSVTKKFGKDALLDTICKHLPISEYLYDPEALSDESIRNIYKEFIREALFEFLSDELPYESDVLIEKIDESEAIDRVYATVIVEKEQQKGMVIGAQAQGIKRIGRYAREQMEQLSGKKIFLDLHVSVKKGWSKNKDFLEELGYIF